MPRKLQQNIQILLIVAIAEDSVEKAQRIQCSVFDEDAVALLESRDHDNTINRLLYLRVEILIDTGIVAKPATNIRIPLSTDETISLIARVKPDATMPRPGAQATKAKPKRKRSKKG